MEEQKTPVRGEGKQEQLSKIAAAINPASTSEANSAATQAMLSKFVKHFETSALEIVQHMDDDQEDLIKKMVDEITKLQTKNMSEFEKAIGKIAGLASSMMESNNPKLKELGSAMQSQAKEELVKSSGFNLTGEKDTFRNRLRREIRGSDNPEPEEKVSGLGKIKGFFSDTKKEFKKGAAAAIQEGSFADRVFRSDEEKRNRLVENFEQNSNETKNESLTETFKKVLEQTLKQSKEEVKKQSSDSTTNATDTTTVSENTTNTNRNNNETNTNNIETNTNTTSNSEKQEDNAGISKDAQVEAAQKTSDATAMIQENSDESVGILKQMLDLLKQITDIMVQGGVGGAGAAGSGSSVGSMISDAADIADLADDFKKSKKTAKVANAADDVAKGALEAADDVGKGAANVADDVAKGGSKVGRFGRLGKVAGKVGNVASKFGGAAEGALGGVGRGALSLASKAAVPLTIAYGAYEGYTGYQEAAENEKAQTADIDKKVAAGQLTKEQAAKSKSDIKKKGRVEKSKAIGGGVGVAGGALAGAALGATVGSIVPGVGTVIGGAVGGVVGGIAGSSAGKWLGEKAGDAINWFKGDEKPADGKTAGKAQPQGKKQGFFSENKGKLLGAALGPVGMLGGALYDKFAGGSAETGKNADSAILEAGTEATRDKMKINVPPPTVINQGNGGGNSAPTITAPGGVRNVRADDPSWLRFQQKRAVV